MRTIITVIIAVSISVLVYTEIISPLKAKLELRLDTINQTLAKD